MTGQSYDLTRVCGPDAEGMTVKGVLRRDAGVSRRLMRSIIHGEKDDAGNPGDEAGGVFVNGARARFADRVKTGDVIGLVYPRETTYMQPEDIPLEILYEDEDLLALNKQPGIVVHPTKGHPSGTVANGIARYMAERGEAYRPRFVNRLDMDTSGVLLIGKNAHVQNAFAAQAGRGETVKKYLVCVSGIVEADEGVIDLPIAPDDEGSPRRVVRGDGAPSVTRFKVLSRKPIDAAYTALEVTIETGRTHQIRVHFSHLGHPVLGDSLYGSESALTRQVLHARSLEFTHPRTGERLKIIAPLPGDIYAFF
ncbi:MAG: RluA family pseudouridine synthase [Clostridiales Family XIII bacterium]|jgi:23S rRNA pseudouridine1911/1915/1917 synthase|nr:RluA family pseudouridine synthase [Clostridiales Family XIII bacterium]